MPTQIDLCNAALGQVGTRSTIASMTEISDEARNCTIFYNFARKAVLRAHAWAFAKKTIAAALICAASWTPENPSGALPVPVWPWSYEYAWPQDCVRFRYQEWPPPQSGAGTDLDWTGNYPPLDGSYMGLVGQSSTSKKAPYAISTDQDMAGNTIKVILSNLEYAIFVYTMDSQDPNMWDDAFNMAFIYALGSMLAGPLTGDVGLGKELEMKAQNAILNARVDDANESPTSTNHIPDWIRARGIIGMESLEYPELDLLPGPTLAGG